MTPEFGPVLSVLYSISFVLIGLIAFKITKRCSIDVNREFYIGSTPLIVLSGFLAFEAFRSNIYHLITFSSITIVMLLLLIISKKIEENTEFDKNMFLFFSGTLSLILYSLITFDTFENLPLLLAVILAWLVPMAATSKFIDSLKNIEVFLPISAHFLDSSTTYVNLQLGGSEQVYLARLFVNYLGDWSIFLLKSLVVMPVVFYIYRDDIEPEKKSYYLYLIYFIGIALASHNLAYLVI